MWLKVQPEGQDVVTLQWGDASGPYPELVYPLKYGDLLDVAGKIRAILDKLSDWAKLKDAAKLRDLLYRLALEGENLHYVIFNSPKHKDAIAELKDWIDDRYAGGDKELKVIADSRIHVPWGLAFSGDAKTLKSTDGAADVAAFLPYEQFWTLKYSLSMVFSAYDRPLRNRRPREACRLLSVVNPSVLAQVEEERPDSYKDLSQLMELPVGLAFNLERCDELLKEASNRETLFHFFGHGVDGKLVLGEEQIDVIRFRRMLDRLLEGRSNQSNGQNLIFLNACETVLGNLDSNFRDAASQQGLCGLVATEATVPRPFAAEFGYRFLKSVLDGQPIGQTMNTLQRELWPLSLLYSCYATASYQFKPAGSEEGQNSGAAPNSGAAL